MRLALPHNGPLPFPGVHPIVLTGFSKTTGSSLQLVWTFTNSLSWFSSRIITMAHGAKSKISLRPLQSWGFHCYWGFTVANGLLEPCTVPRLSCSL